MSDPKPKRAEIESSQPEEQIQKNHLSNEVYNSLRFFTQYVLPGIGTLYFALAAIWGLPYAVQVVGSIAALTAFLGVVLGISKSQYDASGAGVDGDMIIDTSDPLKDTYRLSLNIPIEDLADKDQIIFKVVQPS